MKHIFLVGMPGAGKTLLGQFLTKHIKHKNFFEWVDTDQKIEHLFGCSVMDIFQKHGEKAFREEEAKVIRSLINNNKPTIVSTGGGIFSQPSLRKIMLDKGFVFYLKASVKTLTERSLEGRPLLQTQNHSSPSKSLEHLLSTREEAYQEAHATLPVDGKTPKELVNIMMERIMPNQKSYGTYGQ